MKRILLFLMVLVILIPSTCLAALDKNLDNFLDQYYEEKFNSVEYFGIIRVRTQGDTEKIGLTAETLSNYLRLKFRNNFRGMKVDYEKLPAMRYQEGQKCGTIIVSVWTIGDDYPIAYHIDFNAGKFGDLNVWNEAYLGYGAKENVPEGIKKQINDMVERFAISFYKAKKEI
jgi:hypothetical protein